MNRSRTADVNRFANQIAKYVATASDYNDWSKGRAVIEAVTVLLQDGGPFSCPDVRPRGRTRTPRGSIAPPLGITKVEESPLERTLVAWFTRKPKEQAAEPAAPLEIRYVVGDATAPDTTDAPAIIVHGCNNVGGWGAGFVLALNRRWAEPQAAYKAWYNKGQAHVPRFLLGQVQFVPVEDRITVANLLSQQNTRWVDNTPPVRYPAIEEGLATVAKEALRTGAHVHLPRIGCGLAGGEWSVVEDIIERTLVAPGVPVTVYDLVKKV
jgi:O-acetyl-ADP-ribose deacetylase (regulator of RNase III)